MVLLDVTSQTWFITGIGFGMVLLLLFVFVYIMKFMGWIMQPRKQATPEQPQTQVATPVEDADDATKAAIAFTLQQYYYGVHDLVETHLTVKHHTTAWNIVATENN